jgi:dimethylamine monooxygenase subunit A
MMSPSSNPPQNNRAKFVAPDLSTTLPEPALYVPFRHGRRYDVAPGLTRFRAGESGADSKVFQFDRTWHDYHRAKLAVRQQHLNQHYCTSGLSADLRREVVQFIAQRLVAEHGYLFQRLESGELKCALTDETLALDADLQQHGYHDAFDALACQVQEDLAVISSQGDGRHWLSAAHVCFPNGWAPAEKVGGSFAAVHAPVAGMAEMNRRGDEFAKVMIGAADGLVRFAWGVTFDDELNHHPDRPRTPFNPAQPRAFVRVERQTIWGLPHLGAALFTIRTYLYDVAAIRRDGRLRGALVSALRSMPAASRVYKGLANRFEELVSWIEGGDFF